MFLLLSVLTYLLGVSGAYQQYNTRAVDDVGKIELGNQPQQHQRYGLLTSGDDDGDLCDVPVATNRECTMLGIRRLSQCLRLNVFLSLVKAYSTAKLPLDPFDYALYVILASLVPKMEYLRWHRCKSLIPGGIRTLKASSRYLVREILSICPENRANSRRFSSKPGAQPEGFPGESCYKLTDFDEVNIFKHTILVIFQAQSLISSHGKDFFLSSLRLPCWETDLLTAERLFDQPIKWDVDVKCIAVFRTISTSILNVVLKGSFQLRSYNLVRDDAWIGVKIHSFFYSLAEIFLKLDLSNSDYFLQRWFYPMFNRLLLRSRQSRANNITSSEAPSCKGLRGSPDQVQKTVIKLTRMLMINELRHRKYLWLAHAFISVANQLFMSYLRLCPITISLDV
eukprot:scpid74175/ scgid18483/ 